jgi:hypothetical protein
MRVIPLIAGLVLAGLGVAQAADLPAVPRLTVYPAPAPRVASPLVIYDYEPGVVTRSYWLPPWGYRHYFPATGEAPVFGRDEDLSSRGRPPEEAEDYERHWSNVPAYVPAGRPLPRSLK